MHLLRTPLGPIAVAFSFLFITAIVVGIL